ncbi:hypothetical protein [Embleya scabrispora]|uniref:hypothetical protein n=1 Tax=Embleya scabrispora TaxID=159449 RepID=UPI00036BA0AE|nr:hypothetical protein [Embleya scabrispora]MYS84993.1 hypothetical protein [Streptomyces sp. SID5474]
MTGVTEDGNRHGNLVLLLAAVLFAVLVLPHVLEDDGDDGRSPAGLTAATRGLPTGGLPTGETAVRGLPSDPRRTPGRTTTAPDTRPEKDTPTPVRDPRADAFTAVARKGVCLNAWQTGTERGSGWNTDTPRAVDCDADSAFVRVVGVNATNCPTIDPGITDWRYGTVELCLERQFRQGQCFLVSREGGTGDAPRYSANLFTWVDCGAQRIPSGFDSLLVVTGVYRAPSNVRAGACARAANDRTYYWYWVARSDSTLVCATYPRR